MRAIAFAAFMFACVANVMSAAETIAIGEVPGASAPEGFAEIRGVAAGPFAPELWSAGTLNLVPDHRRPFIDPLQGKKRNIYAPSIVETKDGWRVFYGGWDGVPTGNDRIYCLDATRDFGTFSNRRIIIEHGRFVHVCNVSAVETSPGVSALMCTAYPDARGLNKPAFFDGFARDNWLSGQTPRVAALADIVSMTGYPAYEKSDINGMNVILRESGFFRLYFSSFTDFGKTYRATSPNGRDYTWDGECIRTPKMVNDVKEFVVGGRPTYLMAFHANCPELSYALSPDGMKFEEAKKLATALDDYEKYIVAIGWVVKGDQDAPDRRLLGFLYGAGAKSTLDANRIFARWLQKRIVVTAPDFESVGGAALGPDAQLVRVPAPVNARVHVYAEDGRAEIGQTVKFPIRPGGAYEIQMRPQ